MKKILLGLMAVAIAVITHLIVWYIIKYYPLGYAGAFLIVSIYPIGMMIALLLAEKCYYHRYN